MRTSRILPLVGPAIVLYLVADAAAGGGGLDGARRALAAVAFALTLTPFFVAGLVRDEVVGARAVGALGTLGGISLAAVLQPLQLSGLREVTLAITLPLVAFALVELAWKAPDVLAVRRRARPLLTLATGVVLVLAVVASMPPVTLFGDLVLVPTFFAQLPARSVMVALALALVLRGLRRRLGSSPEALAANAWALLGLVPALALVGVVWQTHDIPGGLELWALGTLTAAGTVVLFGHLALVDPRRRLRAGRSVRRYVAHGATAIAVGAAGFFAHGRFPNEPVPLAVTLVLAWLVAIVFHAITERTVHRLLAPYGGRLLDAIVRARAELVRSSRLEELSDAVLVPLREASGTPEAMPLLLTSDPGREVRLDAAGNARVRPTELPAMLRDVLESAPGRVVSREITTLMVRRAELRPLGEWMLSCDALCVVPLSDGETLEGALVVPRGRRGAGLALEEIAALEALGREVGALVALFAKNERAQRRVGEITRERDRIAQALEVSEEALDQTRAEATALRAGRGASRRAAPAIAYSGVMQALEARLSELAPTEAPLVLVAEPGSPVDAIALRVHERSGRAAGPFVVADCASVRDDAERALFGSAEESRASVEPGANVSSNASSTPNATPSMPGWLRLAQTGTLVLADVPALPLGTQHALAEALAQRLARAEGGAAPYAVDVRIVATSRVPLEPLVAAGAFDPELARWLGTSVVVPPLRERRDDLPSLVLLAIDRACRVLGRETVGIEQPAIDALLAHDWPGNLRELQHVIDRAVARAEGPKVRRSDLPALSGNAIEAVDPFDGTYADVEKRMLEHALARAAGNKSEAARLLGLKRSTFADKLRRYDLDPEKPVEA
ncbi:MAG: sigma 54-interacting transcriptional regulator [Myxococcota bacterium]|nr:sigma 54-interacting transcriptional regulator [Myxococcota bacterium]